MKPGNKTKWPETANQEVGWFSQTYNQVKPRNSYGHQMFWVSDWNANYVSCHNKNPFHASKGSKNMNFSIKDNQMYKDLPPIKNTK